MPIYKTNPNKKYKTIYIYKYQTQIIKRYGDVILITKGS